jgi:PAS domain S-box-containing protein
MSESPQGGARGRKKYILPILIFLGALLFVLTYLGIQKSRSDSLELIRQQGIALIESITLSADNAIKANSLFDLLVQEKFSDLSGFMQSRRISDYSTEQLGDFAAQYDVDAILIFNNRAGIVASGSRGVFVDLETLKSLLIPQVDSLLMDASASDVFQLVSGPSPSELAMFYLNKVDDGKYVIAIVSDALFYSSAKKDIGIGYLIQNIAREVGIEYILFQTPDGIVFSSRKVAPVLKIENDPFLSEALNSDTLCSRIYMFNGRRLLELAKPFSSVEFQSGLFRLGLSLEKYYDIMAGFDRQMIALSVVIFAAIILSMLYLAGQEKRASLDRSFKQIKSLSDTVFESVNYGIIVVNEKGVVESVNRRSLEIFECQESDILGKRWSDFRHREAAPFDQTLALGLSGEEAEKILSLPSGRKNLIVNVARLYDRDARPSGAVAVIYDYTKIKELEETARRKERLTELGDLAAGVAHEIRNPLNAISIAAQRLLAEFEPKDNAEEFQAFARQIRNEADRLNDIVTRFLSLARGNTNAAAPVDLSKAAREAVELMRLDPIATRILINADIDAGIFIPGSPDKFKQVIINLLRNALEASPQDGSGVASLALKKTKDEIILTVIDNGPGVSDEIKKKIFSPYFTTKEKGSGLGLSIVYQIAEEYGGRVEVRTPTAGGAEFRVIFPA